MVIDISFIAFDTFSAFEIAGLSQVINYFFFAEMAAKDKSAMKVSLSRSRFPTFLFFILVCIVFVSLYYCWNLASSNQVLLREMKILESGRLEMERRHSALESQIFEIENERRLAEEDLEKERSARVESENTVMEVSSELHGQLNIAQENEVSINMEMLNACSLNS